MEILFTRWNPLDYDNITQTTLPYKQVNFSIKSWDTCIIRTFAFERSGDQMLFCITTWGRCTRSTLSSRFCVAVNEISRKFNTYNIILVDSSIRVVRYGYLLFAQVQYDGNVTWLTQGIYTSKCDIDVKFYPMDAQNCSLKFASWSQEVTKVLRICKTLVDPLHYFTRFL